MARNFSLPLRHFLVLLVCLGLLPVALIGGWVINASVNERRYELEQSMLALSRALASAIDSELETTVDNVKMLSADPALRGNDMEKFYEVARSTVARQADWRSVIVTDAEGRVLFRTSAPFGATSQVVEPGSLAQAIRTQQPAIGKVTKGKLNQPAVPVRVPVALDGRVRYVVTAALAPDRVLRVLNNQQLPAGWVVSVHDSYGLRVARSLDHERTVGTGMSATLAKLIKPEQREGAGITTTLEGNEVLTTFTRLPRHAWTVAVGAPTAHFAEVLRRTLAAYAMAIIASLALYGALAVFVAQRIVLSFSHLKRQTARLGQRRTVRRAHSRISEVNEMGEELVRASGALLQGELAREKLVGSLQDALLRAEQASATKDNFLAVLGHELRNPLSPILMALDLMDMRANPDSLRERQTMRRQVDHMKRLVDDLLDVSRIAEGKLVMNSEPVCLSAVVTQAADAIRPAMAAQGRYFVESLEEVWVMGDETRLVQVASNLLANALRYGGAGDVVISVARQDGQALLRVADNGIGMDPATAALVFEPFYQAPQPLARSAGGLGLGLTIIFNIVELHGGAVRASSRGPGLGSLFEVALPAIDSPLAGAMTVERVARAQAPRKVVIVDDNHDAAATTAELLSLLGHEVDIAHDGKSGLRLIQAMQPDVAFLDIGLPDMDGFELARAARAIGFAGQLVALTGYGEERDRLRATDAGFNAHLTKPASVEQLDAAIAGDSLAPVSAG
jgi:signal transduction histidine kinase/ActR/RegA family two-component response regulator